MTVSAQDWLTALRGDDRATDDVRKIAAAIVHEDHQPISSLATVYEDTSIEGLLVIDGGYRFDPDGTPLFGNFADERLCLLAGLSDANVANDAINWLVDHDYLRLEFDSCGSRTSTMGCVLTLA